MPSLTCHCQFYETTPMFIYITHALPTNKIQQSSRRMHKANSRTSDEIENRIPTSKLAGEPVLVLVS